MPDIDDVENQIDHGHQQCLDDFAHNGYRGKIDRCERHGRLMIVAGNGWYKSATNMHWWEYGVRRVRIASRLVREEREQQARLVKLPEVEQ